MNGEDKNKGILTWELFVSVTKIASEVPVLVLKEFLAEVPSFSLKHSDELGADDVCIWEFFANGT
jgi:hypothetical protein